MSDPVSFVSASARYKLPFLFSAQSQKEFYVNEAHALVDALLHPAIEGEVDNPPGSPADGECWLVGGSPTGAWAGHVGELACSQSGQWLFAAPRDGIRVCDKQLGQERFFLSGWLSATPITSPDGGSVVDTEARTAIAGLVAALVDCGLLPES